MSRITLLVASLVAAGLSSTGLQVMAAAEERITIVSSLPRTGSANAQTTSIVNGIRLALDEVGGKVGPFSVAYEDWDDASPERGQWDPAVEAANAERAVQRRDIVAYIGTYNSGAAKIAMPKLNSAPLAMVSPGNTWPGLTKAGFGDPSEPAVYRPSGEVTYFRVVPTDDAQGPTAARWAADMGLKRAYVLHDRELYGKGLADMFVRAAPKYGVVVVAYEGIDPKAANYRALVTKMRQLRPDLIFFGGTTQTNGAQLAKDVRAGGVSAKLIFPDGCFENAFIQAAGAENLEGRAYFIFPGVPPQQLTGPGKQFYERYKTKYRIEPEAYAVYGYEAARVVLDAIRRANSADRRAIIASLRQTRDFSGALGTWSFDANGDVSVRTFSGNTVVSGAFSFLRVLPEGEL